ncbi:MAG: transporter substrate-binding domain-containing protein [Silicimonas sp.]|nr:transporter substrate-binding domain-containing protein [Silicimonas sp.]
MKTITALLLLMITSVALPASAEPQALRFTTGDWAPYIFEDDGTVNADRPGFSIEIVNAIMTALGYDPNYTSRPFLRQILETESGEFDAMVVVYAQEAPNLVFPQEPIGISQNCFFALPDGDWRYTGPASLALKKLAINEGYVYGEVDDFIAENEDSILAILGDEPDMMGRLSKLVTLGRADVFIQDREVARHYFESKGHAGKFEIVGCVKEIPVVIGFSPKGSLTPKLVTEFDRAFAELRASGEIARILDRYGVADWK